MTWKYIIIIGTSVLSSCGDLFVFYKKCLVQCAELSTGRQRKQSRQSADAIDKWYVGFSTNCTL